MQCQTAHNSPLAANVSPQSAHNNPQTVHTNPQSAHSSPQQPTTRNDEGRHDRRYTTRHKTHGEPSRLLFFGFLLQYLRSRFHQRAGRLSAHFKFALVLAASSAVLPPSGLPAGSVFLWQAAEAGCCWHWASPLIGLACYCLFNFVMPAATCGGVSFFDCVV